MYPHDWRLFIEEGAGKEIAFAPVSLEIASHLGAPSTQVWIHHDYALKAVQKHRLEPRHFSLIFETLEYGRVLDDKPRHATFLHLTEDGWLQVTIKRAEDSLRLYVATVYKTNAKEVARKSRRYPLLRGDKWTA